MTEPHPNTPTPPPTFPGSPPSQIVYYMEEPINWREYWGALVKHKKVIGLITAMSAVMATGTAFLMTPIYRAEALLAPVSEEKSDGLSALAGQFGDLAALAGISPGGSKDKTAESVAALRSRALATEFINQEDLKPALFPEKWDAEKKKWENRDDVPSDWKAFEMFNRDMRFVQLDRKTGLVTLALEWKDPELAAKWANDLVRRVNERLRTEAIREADSSIGFLEKQLAQARTIELQQAIYRLIEVQTKNKMVANTRQEYAFKVIDAAVAPERRVRPKRTLIILLGVLLGFMLAIAGAFIHNALGRGRAQTGAPPR